MKTPVSYGPFSSQVTIKDQASGIPVGTSYSQESLLGRGKKVTAVYGNSLTPVAAPMPGVWVKIQQGSSWAVAQTGTDAFYVFFDGQSCSGDGIDSCSPGLTNWNFANGTSNVTITILGNGATAATSPTYPTGYTKASVVSGGTTYATFTSPTPPSYTLSVAKSSAYNRDWKFTP
jgi:hypothetical protein